MTKIIIVCKLGENTRFGDGIKIMINIRSDNHTYVCVDDKQHFASFYSNSYYKQRLNVIVLSLGFKCFKKCFSSC